MDPSDPAPPEETHPDLRGLLPTVVSKQRSFGEEVGESIGPFKLLQLLGEGGFGVVWLAERREPMVQRVALKIIKPGMDSKAVIARFEQERQALAVMDHPNIAKVIDGGMTPTGRPYFVMEYVQGEPITEYCDRHRVQTRERLALFVHVCEAVQHAHQKGLIHRDLKPSNILVAVKDDRAIPKVIDFGVAKAVRHSLTAKTIFTEVGQFIGTPEYMSPEQAEMGSTDIDTRSDVYSLGVVLYELLSGLLPFDAASLRSAGYEGIRKVIREVDPPKPSTRLTSADAKAGTEIARSRQQERDSLTRELRRELDWIPMKALRKDRTHRYASPADLARDIKNYLEGQPLQAGPESASYRLKKLIRRNRGPVLAGSVVLLTMILGLAGTTLGFLRAEERAAAEAEAKEKAIRAEAEMAKQRDQAEYESYVANIAVASAAVTNLEPTKARASLDACPPALRDWEWNYLDAALNQCILVFRGHEKEVTKAVILPGGDRIVTISNDHTGRLWDATTGAEIAVLRGHEGPLTSVAISPSGDIIATASRDLTVRLWDGRTGASRSVLRGHTGRPQDSPWIELAFSPSGDRLVSSAGDAARVWNPIDGTQIGVFPARESSRLGILTADFDPTGTRIVTGEDEATARVWDLTTGKEVSRYQSTLNDFGESYAVFHPSGESIVSHVAMRDIEVWNASNGAVIRTMRGDRRDLPVFHSSVSPRGDAVAFDFGGSDVFISELSSGKSRCTLRGHTNDVWSIRFDRTGSRVVTASLDKTARLWDASNGQQLQVLFGHPAMVLHAAFSTAGDAVVTSSSDGTARLWSLAFGSGKLQSKLPSGGLLPSSRSPSGDRWVARTPTWGAAFVFDATTGSTVTMLRGDLGRLNSLTFDASGDRILTTSEKAPARVWDAWSGKEIVQLAANEPTGAGRFSPSGRVIAVAEAGGQLSLFDPVTGQRTRTFDAGAKNAEAIAFHPSGDRLAVSIPKDNAILLLDAVTGRLVRSITLSGFHSELSFSRDGKRLLAACNEGVARLVDLESGTEIAVFRGHERHVGSARFNPAETRVVTTGSDHSLRVWDSRTGREILTVRSTDVNGAEFDPTGERLFYGRSGHPTRVLESKSFAARVQALKAAASIEASMRAALQPRIDAGEDLDALTDSIIRDGSLDLAHRRAGLVAVTAERERRIAEANKKPAATPK
jgi:eukaryotic-like serine/threonine-protein kinase